MKFLLIAFIAFGGAIYFAIRLASVDPEELKQRAAEQQAKITAAQSRAEKTTAE